MFVSCLSACRGWMYRGVCLQKSIASSNRDHIPAGCSAYQPTTTWSISDFQAICNHFGGATCSNVHYSSKGGRCAGNQAVLAYDNSFVPDVWVARSVFTWSPSYSSYPSCNLLSYFPGTIVYACRTRGTPTVAPTSVPPTGEDTVIMLQTDAFFCDTCAVISMGGGGWRSKPQVNYGLRVQNVIFRYFHAIVVQSWALVDSRKRVAGAAADLTGYTRAQLS